MAYWESYLTTIQRLIETEELDMPRYIITVNNPTQTLAVFAMDVEDARFRVNRLVRELGWPSFGYPNADREIVRIERIMPNEKEGTK